MAAGNSDDSRRLAKALERVYERHSHRRLIAPDPLQFVYRYQRAADREMAGFLAAMLAYGRVRQIEAACERLFAAMGSQPAEFVRNLGPAERRALAGFRHRFTSGRDLADLMALLRRALREAGSIEALFKMGYDGGDGTIIPALERFCETLLQWHTSMASGPAGPGFKHLLGSPRRRSACKRLHLFLRWMVRRDDVDPGVWAGIAPAKLIVPVDVHMARLCGLLGLHDGAAASGRTALAITRRFAEIEPADPVKYDFALSRVGIVEGCDGTAGARCRACELVDLCRPARLKAARIGVVRRS